MNTELRKYAFEDEYQVARRLLSYLGDLKFSTIDAKKYIEKIRAKSGAARIENFLAKYSLKTEEGVAIMCLAESLLRIKDHETAKLLISDKLKNKNWLSNIAQDQSWLINSSGWGLALSGKLLDMSESKFSTVRFINRLAEPGVMIALKIALRYLSNKFIIATDLGRALTAAQSYQDQGVNFSFDILGESARSGKQAQVYYNAYETAIRDIGEFANAKAKPSISVKLTALHPRVELAQKGRVMRELMPKLEHLIMLCVKNNIAISFDAEEVHRLDIYLLVFEQLLKNPKFKGYDGLGAVVQAYQKRALITIDHLTALAQKYNKRIAIRLVKGAYWDYEIKRAQESALLGYPVFTNKPFTDLSYLACAKKLLASKHVYPQFATHNAYTVSAIKQMAGRADFEFQKLHGMGDILHQELVTEGYKTRIYAPIGNYENLLAYLMRRMLESGASTSFVNLVGDNSIPLKLFLISPIAQAEVILKNNQLQIPLPQNIYPERINSHGYELGYQSDSEFLQNGIALYLNKKYEVRALLASKDISRGKVVKVTSPLNHKIGKTDLHQTSKNEMIRALDDASVGFKKWSEVEVKTRAAIISKIAKLLYQNYHELLALLMSEAGKNVADGISEIKEAADFALYYGACAVETMSEPVALPGITGEESKLELHPKGIFVTISPWNFPLAIFLGQIFAALVTGNSVIAKPSENTSAIAHFAVKLLYDAGVPRDALQLIITSGRELSENILSDPRVAGVCFTGGTETARVINQTLGARKDSAVATLIAETGGINAMIVDASALPEQACDHIINSAFGSSGQRCSALRVVYIQQEIYEELKSLLIGAMNELSIGDTSDFANDLGAMISTAAVSKMKRHLANMRRKKFNIISHPASKQCAASSGSFFAPSMVEINKIDDMGGEIFGPILHLISYKSSQLDSIIDEINSTGYGLTFGIESRIEARIKNVTGRIKAGNIYINRTTTGAQVGTHPFGGEGKSGTGFKAGGPNYLLRFCLERTVTTNLTAIGGNIDLLTNT